MTTKQTKSMLFLAFTTLVMLTGSSCKPIQRHEISNSLYEDGDSDQSSRTIRKMSAADIPAIVSEFEKSSFLSPWKEQDFHNVIEREGYDCIVLTNNGKTLGYAIVEYPPRARNSELLSLAVHPDYRNRGIGEALLQDAMETAAHRGFDRMDGTISEQTARRGAEAFLNKSNWRVSFTENGWKTFYTPLTGDMASKSRVKLLEQQASQARARAESSNNAKAKATSPQGSTQSGSEVQQNRPPKSEPNSPSAPKATAFTPETRNDSVDLPTDKDASAQADAAKDKGKAAKRTKIAARTTIAEGQDSAEYAERLQKAIKERKKNMVRWRNDMSTLWPECTTAHHPSKFPIERR